MILDPTSISSSAVYKFMISVVVPRPIAFVSTVGHLGFNVAPFSYFTAITNRPPLLGISINARGGEPKDTLRNIRETGDFVINIVTEDLAQRVVQTSGDWPQDVDEFSLTGLTPVASDLVRAPRVAESPVQLECRLHKEIPLGDAAFVVGELVRGHIDEALLTEGHVDPEKLRPLGRLGGDAYARLGDLWRFARPRVERGEKR